MAGLGVGGLCADQLDEFSRNGFLAIESLLTDEDLAPVYDEYERVLDGQIDRLLADGTLSERPDGGFGDRYSAALAADALSHRWFNISLPLINGPVDAESYVMHCGPAVFDLLRHPAILDVVESIIGPEIASNPVQQMRMKPSQDAVADESLRLHSNVGATTWHQDIVALLPDADDTQIVTVWIAVDGRAPCPSPPPDPWGDRGAGLATAPQPQLLRRPVHRPRREPPLPADHR